jgi:hypothetical protein
MREVLDWIVILLLGGFVFLSFRSGKGNGFIIFRAFFGWRRTTLEAGTTPGNSILALLFGDGQSSFSLRHPSLLGLLVG